MATKTDRAQLAQALTKLVYATERITLARIYVNQDKSTNEVAAYVKAAEEAEQAALRIINSSTGGAKVETNPDISKEMERLTNAYEMLETAVTGKETYKNILSQRSTTSAVATTPSPPPRGGAAEPATRDGTSPTKTGAAVATSAPVLANVTNAGAFSPMPRATPKYAVNNGNRSDYVDTMARLYLWLTPQEYGEYAKLAVAASQYDKRLKVLAAKLGVGSDNRQGIGYVEFLLQEAVHNHAEKVEVVETLAHKHVLYAFGAEPPTYNYAAYLLNNKQDDQAANLQRLYWTFLRAGQLAHLRTQVHLQYNEMLVSGVMTNLQLSLSANDESFQRAAFQILVRSVRMLPSSDTINSYNPGDVGLDSLTPLPEVLTVSQTQSWPSVTPIQLRVPTPTALELGERASLPRPSSATKIGLP